MAEYVNLCGACGHDNLPDSQFCGGCGVALLPPAPKPPNAVGPAGAVDRAEPTRAAWARDRAAASGAGTPAGLWQRVVMGLAAVILLAAGVSLFFGGNIFPFYIGALLVLAGTGFGFATFRPPGGHLRRFIVGFAILVILLPVAAMGLYALAIFVWYRY